VKEEIWAYGFRNPWQFSFDPLTGDFYVGDVGAENWEEINFQPAGGTAGQNYGWDFLEASHCFPADIESCPRQQIGVLPVAEYEHGFDGCAVIGVGVYRSQESPELDGVYFSGDYCSGEIRGMQRDADGVWQFENLLDTALQITGSGQDANGDLYVTAVTSRKDKGEKEGGNGSIWKLVAAGNVPEGATTIALGSPEEGDRKPDKQGQGEDADLDEPTDNDVPAANDEPTPQAAAATPAASGAPAVEFAIDMYDIFFAPTRIRIPANTDVRLVFQNDGAGHRDQHRRGSGGHGRGDRQSPGRELQVRLQHPRAQAGRNDRGAGGVVSKSSRKWCHAEPAKHLVFPRERSRVRTEILPSSG